eukprot:scaffold55164_cov65-Attheya_sp.AAC.1
MKNKTHDERETCNNLLNQEEEELQRTSDDEQSDSSEDDSDGELQLRCRAISQTNHRSQQQRPTPVLPLSASSNASSLELSGVLLASCHIKSASALVWDLASRRVVSTFGGDRSAPGLALERLGSYGNQQHQQCPKFFYQTRNEEGTVSIHVVANGTGIETSMEIETYSRSFCKAAPCHGNPHLVALPSANEAWVTIRDIRVDPKRAPIATLHGGGLSGITSSFNHTVSFDDDTNRQYGMVTSLAMADAPAMNDALSIPQSSSTILACGMESGHVFFHDLAMLKDSPFSFKCPEKDQEPLSNGPTKSYQEVPHSSIQMGKNPILCLDVSPSCPTRNGTGHEGLSRSVVAVAGAAGDAAELSELPEKDRGTVGVIKAWCSISGDSNENGTSASNGDNSMKARLRSRVGTCRIDDHGGKPGVSICRFRPHDGAMFAVGGWDRRVRVFGRSSAKPLAILRGHTESVTAIDWAPHCSGILSTGSSDGRISIWKLP